MMDISSWMIDNISVASPTGAVDDYGQRVYDTARTVACRIEQAHQLLVDLEGNERTAKSKIAVDQEITWEDKIWLPGETPTTDPSKRPISIIKASNKDGTYIIWEVML